MAITDRNQLQPYSPDGAQDPDQGLAAQLGAAVHGAKADPMLEEFRAHLEGRAQPAGTLAAAEDAFKRDMERGNQTPSSTDDWS